MMRYLTGLWRGAAQAFPIVFLKFDTVGYQILCPVTEFAAVITYKISKGGRLVSRHSIPKEASRRLAPGVHDHGWLFLALYEYE